MRTKQTSAVERNALDPVFFEACIFFCLHVYVVLKRRGLDRGGSTRFLRGIISQGRGQKEACWSRKSEGEAVFLVFLCEHEDLRTLLPVAMRERRTCMYRNAEKEL